MSENLLRKARGLMITKFRIKFQESAIAGIPPKKDSHVPDTSSDFIEIISLYQQITIKLRLMSWNLEKEMIHDTK